MLVRRQDLLDGEYALAMDVAKLRRRSGMVLRTTGADPSNLAGIV